MAQADSNYMSLVSGMNLMHFSSASSRRGEGEGQNTELPSAATPQLLRNEDKPGSFSWRQKPCVYPSGTTKCFQEATFGPRTLKSKRISLEVQ